MPIESPKVSVIVLASKQNKYLTETINSIRLQTFTDVEILIFHQGNSPDLIEWCDREPDSRLQLFFHNDLNHARIFNWGIKEAKGEYIAFLMGDDLWHHHKLQKQVFYLDHYPAIALVHSWLMLVNDRHKPLGKILKNQLSGWVELEILQRNQIARSSVMVRRHCFAEVDLFDPQLPTTFDWDMWIRLSRYFQFMTLSEPLVYYRQRPDTIKDSWLKMETDFQATIEKAYADVPTEILIHKNRSYGYASLNLAWKVLCNQSPDPVIADNYCRQALEHSPCISFSREFLQVSLAILTLHWLKSDRYLRLLALIQTFRSWLQAIVHKFKSFAHLVVVWMLEEEEVRNQEIPDSASPTGVREP